MNKKGITLIELLSVIVILAVISLISTPVIIGVIENAKKSASKDSAISYINEVIDYLSLNDYKDEKVTPDGTYSLIEPTNGYKAFNDYIELKGDKPTGGEITLKNSKIISAKMCVSGYIINYNGDDYSVGANCKSIVSPFDIRTTSTSSTIIVNTEVRNSENIKKYYYSINGSDYVESTENTHIFSKLKANTKYLIYVKIENNYGEQEVNSIEETTGDISIPLIDISPAGDVWSISKYITITYPTAPSGETYTYDYSIDGGNNWTNSAKIKNLTFTSKGNIIARVYDGTNYVGSNAYSFDKIDTTIPTTNFTIDSTTTSKATVTAVCSDSESGITKYQFYLDGTLKQTYQIDAISQSYTYTSLLKGNHTLKVVCTNGSEATNSKEIETAQQVVVPTFEISTTGWAASKNVTITYPTVEGEDLTYSYSIDEGNSWTTSATTTKVLTFTAPGNVIARVYDGTNYLWSVYNIDKIDTTIPSTSLTLNSTTTSKAIVTAICSDTESGITKYEFYLDGVSKQTYTTSSTTQSFTYTSLVKGSHTLKVVCTNGSNLTNNKEVSSTQTTVVPTYAISTTGWATSKNVTITYPTAPSGETFTYSYSIDGGINWTTSATTTKVINFTASGNVIARVYDGTNYFAGSSYTIDKIDTTAPTCGTWSGGSTSWTNANRVISLTCSDGGSGCTAASYSTTYSSGTIVSATPSITISDSIGNSRVCTSSSPISIYIDKDAPTKPTVALYEGTVPNVLKTYTSGTWTNKDIMTRVGSTDSGSGINYYQYSNDLVNWGTGMYSWASPTYANGTTKTQLDYWINFGGSWNFYLRSVDNAGNVSAASDVFTENVYKGNLDYFVSNNGSWFSSGSNGATVGTTGQSKMLDGIAIAVPASHAGLSGGIYYDAHFQDYGWQNGNTYSIIRTGKRLEALRIILTGSLASYFDIYYRTYVENAGWLGWARNGGEAGSATLCRRMEAVQMVLVPKNITNNYPSYLPYYVTDYNSSVASLVTTGISSCP